MQSLLKNIQKLKKAKKISVFESRKEKKFYLFTRKLLITLEKDGFKVLRVALPQLEWWQ